MRKEKEPWDEPEEKSDSLRYSQLPVPLQKRFMKHVLMSLCIVVFSCVLILNFKHWVYGIGFLFSLYILYLGFDIIWGWQKGKIVARKMVCIKATRVIKRERLYTIMRDMEDPQGQTYHFYLAANAKDTAMITPNTVLLLYFNPNNLLEAIAWEIIDNMR